MQYALIFYDLQLILAQMPYPPTPLRRGGVCTYEGMAPRRTRERSPYSKNAFFAFVHFPHLRNSLAAALWANLRTLV